MTREDKRVWTLIIGTILLFALMIPISAAVFRVNYTYTLQIVAMGGALLGIVSGVLGCFAVLRQESLMGDALSHAALPGVTLGFLIAGRELGALLIGAGIASWVGVQFILAITRTTRIKQDAAMGIVLVVWFAAGLTLLTYIQGRPDASQAGLDKFIFGQAAAIVQSDVELMALVALVVFAFIAFFWRQFKLITFDREFATANGFNVRLLDTLLSTLIVVAIVLGLQLAGVILMVGMLIAPAVAARQWTHKFGQMVTLAAVFGAFAGSSGAIISAVDQGLPTGPLMIVVAFTLVFVSIAFAPGRGMVWSILQQRGDRRRFAARNLLLDLYRYALGHSDDPRYPAPESFLIGIRGSIARLGLHQLQREGLAEQSDNAWRLTLEGAARAAHEVRNQRLWDAYRQYGDSLGLPAIPENRQRDITLELPENAVVRLEQVLNGQSQRVSA
jgi:manganese/zinc/iron transport system permease protein